MSASSILIDSDASHVEVALLDAQMSDVSLHTSENKLNSLKVDVKEKDGVAPRIGAEEQQYYEEEDASLATSSNSFVQSRYDSPNYTNGSYSNEQWSLAPVQCICFLREFVHCHAHTEHQQASIEHGNASGSFHILSTLSRHEIIENEYDGPYVNYEIVVVNAPLRWTVWRRYSEFRNFHSFLLQQAEFRDEEKRKPPKFPSKKWFGQLKQDFVENRKAQQTVYWDELMQYIDILTYIPEFLSFIGILHNKVDPSSSGDEIPSLSHSTLSNHSNHSNAQNNEDSAMNTTASIDMSHQVHEQTSTTSPTMSPTTSSHHSIPNHNNAPNANNNTKNVMVEVVLGNVEIGDQFFMRNSGLVHSLHRKLFKTDYDHVGIVVRLPPLSMQPQSLYQLEATTEGVHLLPLKERLYSCNTTNVKFGYRRLLGVRPDTMRIALANIAELHEGKRYKFAPSLKDRAKIEDSSNKKGFFCSEIVALALQKCGILNSTRAASSYFPSHQYELQIPGGLADGFVYEANRRVNFRYPEIHFAQVLQSKGWFTTRGMERKKNHENTNNNTNINGNNVKKTQHVVVPFYIYAQCCSCISKQQSEDATGTTVSVSPTSPEGEPETIPISLARKFSLLGEITRCLMLPSGVTAKHVWDQEAEVLAMGQQPGACPPTKIIRDMLSDKMKGQLLQPEHAYQVPANLWNQIHDKSCVLNKLHILDANQETSTITIQLPLPLCKDHVRRQRSRALVEDTRDWIASEDLTQEEIDIYDQRRLRRLQIRGESPAYVGRSLTDVITDCEDSEFQPDPTNEELFTHTDVEEPLEENC